MHLLAIITLSSPIKGKNFTFEIINKYYKALFYEYSYNNFSTKENRIMDGR